VRERESAREKRESERGNFCFYNFEIVQPMFATSNTYTKTAIERERGEKGRRGEHRN